MSKNDSEIAIEKELHFQKERLSLALEATGFDVWENNFITGYSTQPDKVYKKAGYEKGEVPQSVDGMIKLIHPDDVDAIFTSLNNHLDGNGDRYHAEFRFKKKSGDWMWLANFGKVYEKTADGTPIRLVGLTLDITEKKEKELELRELNKNLEKRVEEELKNRLIQESMIAQQSKMAMMGEMVAVIAHQWRQPLNIINLQLSNLVMSHEFDEINDGYIKEYQRDMQKQIDFMSSTVNEFKDFLKPIKLKQPFSIKSAIKEVIQILEKIFAVSQIKIKIKSHPDIDDAILGYKNEFKHTILNLLINSKDAYIQKNSKKVEVIDIDIQCNDDNIAILVQDSAGGIPDDEIESIFDIYVSTKENDGTGIGLYITKAIIEKMGGTISVKNHDNGALFTILLPNIKKGNS